MGAAVAVTLGGAAGGMILANGVSEESNVVAIDPIRILDTRSDLGLAGAFESGTLRTLQVTGSIASGEGTKVVVPTGATGVFLNVTVDNPTAGGFIQVKPSGEPPSVTSNVNFANDPNPDLNIDPNLVLVELPVDGTGAGKLDITYTAYNPPGSVNVIADVVGYMIKDDDPIATSAGGAQTVALSTSAQSVRAVSVTPSANGQVIVNSSATVSSETGADVRCEISDGIAIGGPFAQRSMVPAGGNDSLAGTRGFTVTPGGGVFTAYLVCDNASGDATVINSSMTAIFIPG